MVDCPYCGSTGEACNDDENFKRVHFGHHGPATECLTCGCAF